MKIMTIGMKSVMDKLLSVQCLTTMWAWMYPNDFHKHLNNISPHIKFTIKIQQNDSLPLLDVLITHIQDGSLSHQLYQRKTHIDK